MKIVDAKGSQCAVVAPRIFGEQFLFGNVEIEIPGYRVIARPGHWVMATPEIPMTDASGTKLGACVPEDSLYVVKHGTPRAWHLFLVQREDDHSVQADLENPVIVIKEGHNR